MFLSVDLLNNTRRSSIRLCGLATTPKGRGDRPEKQEKLCEGQHFFPANCIDYDLLGRIDSIGRGLMNY